MNLNSRGQAVLGQAGGPCSVDGRVLITPGGGACWFDDEWILVNTGTDAGGWRVAAVEAATGVDLPLLEGGANALCAGGGRWLGWRPDLGLFGSLGIMPRAGLRGAGRDGTLAYCRDYQSGRGLVLHAPDGLEVEAPADIFAIDVQVLGPTSALWNNGKGRTEVLGRAPVRPALPTWRLRLASVGGVEWLVYWCEGVGLIAQVDGADEGYILETRPIAFSHDAAAVNGELVVAWSTTLGEGPSDLVKVVVDRTRPRVPLVQLPPPPPPPPREAIGPRSDSLPAGTLIEDLLRYVLGKPETWPRIGPSHTLGQRIRPGNRFSYQKFAGNERELADGQSYEDWWWSRYWIGQLTDATAFDPYSRTDQRMWPRRMRVGEAHAWVSPPHEIVWRKRPDGARVVVPSGVLPQFGHHAALRRMGLTVDDRARATLLPCEETRREPWQYRLWIHRCWPKFYWGPDLGVRATVLLVSDATAGFFQPGRYIEAGYYAWDAGSCQWEAHKSWTLYPPGAPEAQFTEESLAERKGFYLIGGPDPAPRLLTCFDDTVPEYPFWDPDLPKPPASSLFQHKGVSMEIDGKIVVARGFKGMLLRPDAPGTGIWGTVAEPKGAWRGGLWDSVDTGSNECRYRVKKHPSGNGRYTLTNLAHNCLAGEDFGEYTPAINLGFYHKPDGNTDAGDLEQWRVYEGNQNGALEAQCEHVTSKEHPAGEGKKFFGYPLSLEVVS